MKRGSGWTDRRTTVLMAPVLDARTGIFRALPLIRNPIPSRTIMSQSRREFLKTAGLGGVALAAAGMAKGQAFPDSNDASLGVAAPGTPSELPHILEAARRK